MKDARRDYEVKRFLHNAQCMKKNTPQAKLMLYKKSNIGGVAYKPIELFVCDTVDELEFWLTSHPIECDLLSGKYTSMLGVCTRL